MTRDRDPVVGRKARTAMQDSIFANSEGNRWFARNQCALQAFDPADDMPLKLLDFYKLRPQNALEIGAANGFRLAELQRRCGARVVAVELSRDAVEDGKARFPLVTFVQAAASAVPLQEVFDLVIINFVLHWIDRGNLLRTVAEIDRLVADGGFLIIGDFYPSNRAQVPYHHLPVGMVQTYKQDYSGVFLSSGLYHPVCLMTAHLDHAAKTMDAEVVEEERIGTWLLRKQLHQHYVKAAMNGTHG